MIIEGYDLDWRRFSQNIHGIILNWLSLATIWLIFSQTFAQLSFILVRYEPTLSININAAGHVVSHPV
jgi:hypothetical protein